MTNEGKKEQERTFSLDEPQIRLIFNALENYATDTLPALLEIAEKEGDKEQIKSCNEDHDIVEPLRLYFREFYFLIRGMPEVESVLECKPLLGSARKNWDEQIEYQKRMTKLWEYRKGRNKK
jgi:hypothetical protein